MKNKLAQYVEADSQEKAASSIKKSLRDYLGKLLRRCRRQGIDIEGVEYEPCERYTFNEELLYEWVKENVDSETLEFLTKKTIDLDRLHDLSISGKIDTSKLSEDTYKITKYFKITVNHKKVNKWKK